ncbi:MAG: hypothetical protein ACI8PZ_004993 [Myxococcota bacterium]|jgi:hypothetical protein
MPSSPHHSVAAGRRRDLLLTSVMLAVLLTPAWLAPPELAIPWLLACLLLAAPALWLSWTHAPWVPTPTADLPYILAALTLQPGERFCDLGAGDGRMIRAVRDATGATCTGVEAAPLLFSIAWARLALGRDGGATVRLGDLYGADLSGFDAVYVWGTPYSVGTDRFRSFLERSLPAGARVVSYHQPVSGWTPTATITAGQRPIYLYSPAPSARIR